MARGRNRFAYNELQAPPPLSPSPLSPPNFRIWGPAALWCFEGSPKVLRCFQIFPPNELAPPNTPPTDAAILNWEVRPQSFSWLFIGCSKYVWGADFFHYGWMAAKPCPCLTKPYYIIPYHTILNYASSYHTIICLTKPYHVMPYHTIPCYTLPYHTILCLTILYYIMPHQTIPWYAILYHTIPHHAIQCLT